MDFLQYVFQNAFTPERKIQTPKEEEVQKCNLIYRDELNKKTAPLKVKKKVQFEVERDKSETEKRDKYGIQVKILMTKEEAKRLLSKCKDGGILEFKDAADELVRIPKNRVMVV